MAEVSNPRDNSVLPTGSRQTPRHDHDSGILISGSCQGHEFVATEVLICADTLGAEAAIRAWLAQHGIPVAPSSVATPSRDNGSPETIRP